MKTLGWLREQDKDDVVMNLTPRECSDCKSGTRFEEHLDSLDKNKFFTEDATMEPNSPLSRKRFVGLMHLDSRKRECLLDDSRLYPV